MKTITKSKYLNFLQCKKLFYKRLFEPESIPEPDLSAQAIFDQGDEVGQLALKRYPDGIDIPFDNFKQNLEDTQRLLKNRRPLFEAGFLHEQLFCRVDILEPAGDDSWNIIEVKSSTQIKDTYIEDISFQYYCLNKAGFKVDKCYLMNVNNSYVRDNEIDVNAIFNFEDVSEQVLTRFNHIETDIKAAIQFADNTNLCPTVEIGIQCEKPYNCALKNECWSHIPKHSIFELYRLNKAKKLEHYFNGIEAINEIPNTISLSETQLIQKDCVTHNKVHLNKELLSSFINDLEYPIYYMDFETIFPAIPLYQGMKPYSHLCFQYSVHIQTEPDGKLIHKEYLATEAQDPRREFITQLLDDLDEQGTILVFNQSFEIGRLRELANQFPELENRIKLAIHRVKDLYAPFRSFSYYNPCQHGSASIKKVLPALTGKGYEDLDIAQGGDACAKYYYCTYKNKPGFKKEDIYPALLKYCGLDTEGMVRIVDELRNLIN